MRGESFIIPFDLNLREGICSILLSILRRNPFPVTEIER